MKHILLSLVLFMFVFALSGQEENTEYWRESGYKARISGDYATAIENYGKILLYDSTDYDALLALARLYAISDDFNASIKLFNEIYSNDSSDLNALNGLGNAYLRSGKLQRSISCYEKALQQYPEEIQQYFLLAKAYSFAGKIDNAIGVYNEVLSIDYTYAEAWAGIGKMYYWKGMPEKAMKNYNCAIALDPENKELLEESRKVQNELRFKLTIKAGPVRETEENYEINAVITRIKFEKRINDHFLLEANYLLDHSNRVFNNHIGDTMRWYSNSWIKAKWLTEHHTISGWVGYTTSDTKFSAYGLSWEMACNVGMFTLKNTFTGGYDYYYYWNEVGAKSVSDILGLSFGKLEFTSSIGYGIVDAVLIEDVYSNTYGVHDNSYRSCSFSLAYQVLSKPVARLGLKYSYLDYTYKSPLYYTPFDRNLTGGFVSLYYQLNRFYFYGYFSYNFGTEMFYEQVGNGQIFKEEKIDVDNWSANMEFGYRKDPFSISIGGSNFYNPFYRNLSGFASFKILF